MRRLIATKPSPTLLASVTIFTFVASLASSSAIARSMAKPDAGGSKVGDSCSVTSGSNKGSNGTYTEDEYGNLWCEGDWGGTECSTGKSSSCTDASGGRPPLFEKPVHNGGDVLAPIDPQYPDLIVDSMTITGDLVTRGNGFTYVPVEIRIANAGSAKTLSPFKISSGYYDYQDDVGPSSFVVPDQVNQTIDAGGAITLLVDVAVPYATGLASPFSVSIEIDSCSSNDAGINTSICRVKEDNESNNSAEVTL